jgi:peptidoglycan/xylan/chitin deacetylase (PgdA/CDA1 family)
MALDQYAVTPTFAINSQLVERTPYLVEKIAARGDEILGHG